MATTYDNAFYAEMKDSNLSSAREIIPLVLDYVMPTSVIDVGCGTGLWLSVFVERGISKVHGVDGAWVEPAQLMIKPEQFAAYDLKQFYSTQQKFDLAACLEIAEHLPAENASTLVQSLVEAAPIILFSAAIPFQGGAHHVNEQWPAYWEKLFAAHDYIPIDCIREQVWDNPKVSFFYAQNMFFYIKRTELVKYPKLQAAAANGHDKARSLVHPHLYEYHAQRWNLLVPFLGRLPIPFLHTVKKVLARLRRKR